MTITDQTLSPRFPLLPLPPGSTIGIMGGGQLGRMTALAAATLGYRCHIFTPEANSPAAQVSAAATVAAYTDFEALERFAGDVDVVTFEFENAPFECVQALARRVPVRPDWECLRLSQDRLIEKDFINSLGIPTTAYRAIGNRQELAQAVSDTGLPAVLKTTRLGYDGKGQILVNADTDLDTAWETMVAAGVVDGSDNGAVLESFVDLAMEISVVIARGADGNRSAFIPVENRHVNHILHETHAPAILPEDLGKRATGAALTIAENMNITGLLAVEMFITTDPATKGIGPDSRLLVNEIAPRPHNSGHWTMDACISSQFDQFVRAVAGLPLGPAERHHDAVMRNLIGDQVHEGANSLGNGRNPAEILHLYGKQGARPGRKMGHINRLYPLNTLNGPTGTVT